ncbi:MAG: flagellar assembly protein FliH [Alcaligenaceae bacterium]|nr:flagellar assembly protein FliH [Alcaligenaceae bacterium]
MSDRWPSRLQAAQAWKRWEMDSFEDPKAPEPAAPAAPPAPDPEVLRAEVQRLRDAAQARGRAEGYAEGHEQGLAAGKEEGRIAGQREGYAKGHAEGLEDGRRQAQSEAAQLAALAQSCARSLAAVEAEMGQALIALSIRIAEQVLRSTLDEHPEKLLDLIRDIIHVESGKGGLLKLRVNPADFELVQGYLRGEGEAENWRLLADPAVERGGCMAETALGNIDATLRTRWERVTSSLGHRAAPLGKSAP